MSQDTSKDRGGSHIDSSIGNNNIDEILLRVCDDVERCIVSDEPQYDYELEVLKREKIDDTLYNIIKRSRRVRRKNKRGNHERDSWRPVSSYGAMYRYFSLLQREVFRASKRLGLPSYVRETAMAIAGSLENTRAIRRSRIPVYVAASIRVACEIHGIDIPIKRILLASNSDGKRARHMLRCMEAAWWAAEKIYPGARKRAKEHSVKK